MGDPFGFGSYAKIPEITSLAGGGYALTYRQDHLGITDRQGVYAVTFGADNQVLAGPAYVDEANRTNGQDTPAIAATGNGGFVVCWNEGTSIKGQFYNAIGVKTGPLFVVAAGDVAASPEKIAVAQLSDGTFVVAWTAYNAATVSYDIMGRLLDASGNVTGSPFVINEITAGMQRDVSVQAFPEGGFLASWSSWDGISQDVAGRYFNNAGTAQGADFLISGEGQATNRSSPELTLLTNGNVVAVYNGPDADGGGILASVFSAGGGTPVSSSFSIAATDATKNEGDSGTTAFTFTVTRGGDTSGTASVWWTFEGSGLNPAEVNADFVTGPASYELRFAAGQSEKTIAVNVAGDTVLEGDEGFRVTLANPSSGGLILVGSAEGTILRDEHFFQSVRLFDDHMLLTLARISHRRDEALSDLFCRIDGGNGAQMTGPPRGGRSAML